MDENRNEIEGNQVVGSLCIKFPCGSMKEQQDHQRYKDTYIQFFQETMSTEFRRFASSASNTE
jgi:acetyl-CoA synthetase